MKTEYIKSNLGWKIFKRLNDSKDLDFYILNIDYLYTFTSPSTFFILYLML